MTLIFNLDEQIVAEVGEKEADWGDFEYLRQRLLQRAIDYEPIKQMIEKKEQRYMQRKCNKMLKAFNDPLDYLSVLKEYSEYKKSIKGKFDEKQKYILTHLLQRNSPQLSNLETKFPKHLFLYTLPTQMLMQPSPQNSKRKPKSIQNMAGTPVKSNLRTARVYKSEGTFSPSMFTHTPKSKK